MMISKSTLTNIAKLSGVSITTVSRVIHTPHLTSIKTQKRVNDIISKLGVNKHFIKSLQQKLEEKQQANHSLVHQKILVLDNQISESLINQGIEDEALKLGLKIMYMRFKNFDENDIQQVLEHVVKQNIDGIVVINNSPYAEFLKQYQRLLPPMIFVNHYFVGQPCVYFDHLANAYEATKYLTNLGHHRIAILLGDEQSEETKLLKQGYLQAHLRENIDVIDDFIIYHPFDYASVMCAIKQLMQQKVKPTAVICCDRLGLNHSDISHHLNSDPLSYTQAINSSIYGVIDQCKLMKINIPDDLSLLQFVDHKTQCGNHFLSQLSAIYKPAFEMGQQSIKQLTLMLKKEPIPLSFLMSTELLSRQSTQKNQHYRI